MLRHTIKHGTSREVLHWRQDMAAPRGKEEHCCKRIADRADDHSAAWRIHGHVGDLLACTRLHFLSLTQILGLKIHLARKGSVDIHTDRKAVLRVAPRSRTLSVDASFEWNESIHTELLSSRRHLRTRPAKRKPMEKTMFLLAGPVAVSPISHGHHQVQHYTSETLPNQPASD